MFWRLTLSTGHGVYDTLTKRLEGGDPLWLILVVRVFTDNTNKKPLKVIWYGDMGGSGCHVLLDGWSNQSGRLIYDGVDIGRLALIFQDNIFKQDTFRNDQKRPLVTHEYTYRSSQLRFLSPAPPTTFFLGMTTVLMNSNRFVNASLSIAW